MAVRGRELDAPSPAYFLGRNGPVVAVIVEGRVHNQLGNLGGRDQERTGQC